MNSILNVEHIRRNNAQRENTDDNNGKKNK
jgi:hypothetical protein